MNQQINSAEDLAILLTQRLQQITIDNGYATDIGTRVFRGRRKIDHDAVPCVVMIEGLDRVDDDNHQGAVIVTHEYAFSAYLKCDPNNPNDMAYKAIRDLKIAMFKDGRRLGYKVLSATYQGREIGTRNDGEPYVQAVMHMDVRFTETLVNRPVN